jgi:subtilisin family serine protease
MFVMPTEAESEARVPSLVMGYVSVASQGGTSILDADDVSDAEPFHGSRSDREDARHAVEAAGLEIVADSALGLAVAGAPEAYAELTGARIEPVERLVHTRAGRVEYVTHLDLVGQDQPSWLGVGSVVSSAAIEAVILERPRTTQAIFPSPIGPKIARWHLDVPEDVALLLGASSAHRAGRLGDGAVVAMVDSGHYAHPYFRSRAYDVRPPVALVPGTSAAKDPHGHGTGESANIFAIAPAATLRPYRASDDQGRLVAAVGAFLRAKGDRPDVLTNSWGGDGPFPPAAQPDPADQAFAVEIRDAVQRGIVVVFSAGNGHFSVEPQVPGVVSAGGVYASPGLDLRASDYASGYESPWFGGVTVPIVCGLVGLVPRASYIELPIPPGCPIDQERSQPGDGDPADGTAANDGWALFSGTSAAAPQIAGAAALIRAARAGAPPALVSRALSETAVDVRAGRCSPRFDYAAGPGRDVATGFGLINASAAVERALVL